MTRDRFSRLAPILACVLAWHLVPVQPAAALSVVPPGNRHAEQPGVPAASARRTAALKSTYQLKYEKIRDLIAGNADLKEKIGKAARAYGIDPIHIVAALVGEHTYNVDAMDRLQTYYVKALSYLSSGVDFAHDGESIEDFVARPEFSACSGESSDEAVWSCRETVFDASFRGRTVGGRSYPDDRFGAVFFQPFYAGQTFGLGQINPLTALSFSDVVHRVSGFPELKADKAPEVYQAIMDPDRSLAYMAATIKGAISAYRDIAGMDISDNPGITATLYNVGNARKRAIALAAENRRRAAAGEAPKLPEENYYGWLANDKLDELQTAIR
ncbi:hypothetical protein Sa4125_44070 [Aureimonas sp. SA4125]|uniref:DUF1402 family protein n=1 Tax=Aureimonas sp. SA4125 TaxID=2826993 RepID=UPI001CC5ADBB|nr:DUF1402 family protein [Aureimonas sp. SA4125]BDA86865.1 hypothetical protein Sa4125_44070 [Aureimonas sp. SA4125]